MTSAMCGDVSAGAGCVADSIDRAQEKRRGFPASVGWWSHHKPLEKPDEENPIPVPQMRWFPRGVALGFGWRRHSASPAKD